MKRYKTTMYCISKLKINGEYFCDVLEDTDRGLKQTDPLELIKKLKINGATAIPIGRYKIAMDTVSPKYSDFTRYPWAKAYGGKMPRLLNVPGFEGILVHIGNYPKDTSGCLLVGTNSIKGAVTQSTMYFNKLMAILLDAHRKGQEIWITIE